MDNIDRATAQAEYEEQERLAQIERRMRQNRHLVGTTHCVDCSGHPRKSRSDLSWEPGETIPDNRRAASPGTCRCLECQQYYEKEKNHAPH